MTKIKFRKGRYKLSYFVGPIFIVVSALDFFSEGTYCWRCCLYFFVGITFTILLLFDKEFNYLLIDEENFIKTGRVFSNRVKLNEVTDCNIEGDLLKITTNGNIININLRLIDDASLIEFISYINDLCPSKHLDNNLNNILYGRLEK